MELKTFNVGDLNPAEYNPRTITDEALKGLESSINEFGYMEPIIVNQRENQNIIVSGHQRLKALQNIGVNQIDCVVVDLDKTKEKALNITMNNKHISGDWDVKTLEPLLSELTDDFAGFTDINLDGLTDEFELSFEDEKEPQTDEDQIPKESENIVIKLGDLIELGSHRVLCGDSTKKEDVGRLMGGEKADMVFTDPPYGVNYQSNMRVKSEKFDTLKNDDTFITEWIPHLNAVSTGFVFIWTSWKVLKEWVEFTAQIGDLSNLIIWNKGGGGIGDLEKTFSSDYEIALVFHRGSKILGKRIGSVWGVGKDDATEYLHPTQKPVALCETALESVTRRKNKVLDFFLGSGSTLIASEKTGRKCYGMELDKKYCQVIVQRWCDYTGEDKIKINGQEINWNEYIK